MAASGSYAWRISTHREMCPVRPMKSCGPWPPSAWSGIAKWCIKVSACTSYRVALEILAAQGATFVLHLLATGNRGFIVNRHRRPDLSRHLPEWSDVSARSTSDTRAGRRCKDRIHRSHPRRIAQNLAVEIGDFVLRRADDIIAYQLAVVVDDADQGITEIIRGADLLASTPRQIFLQRLLGYPTPRYGHLPIATNGDGEKLSKQTLAQPIDIDNAAILLFDALQFLGQSPPAELRQSSQKPLWDWALGHWSLANVPGTRARKTPMV